MKRKFNLFLIAAFLASPIAFATEIYKWTDADGNVYYSDRAPRTGAKKLSINTGVVADRETAARRDRQGDLLKALGEERDIKQKDDAVVAEQKAATKAQCERAKKLLAGYKNSSYLYSNNPNGTRTILTDEQKNKAMEDAEDSIKTLCNS